MLFLLTFIYLAVFLNCFFLLCKNIFYNFTKLIKDKNYAVEY